MTMGVSGIDPNKVVGTYVEARDWNELISDPDVLLLDTRNNYEVEIGSFAGAVNPGTNSFREFPDYVKNSLIPASTKKLLCSAPEVFAAKNPRRIFVSRGLRMSITSKAGF